METATIPAPKLGRLKSMGIQEPWQVALLLPDGYEDLRHPVTRFSSLPEGRVIAAQGKLLRSPQVVFTPGKPPRLFGSVHDAEGAALRFTVFGNSRAIEEALKAHVGESIRLYGKIKVFAGVPYLDKPQLIPEAWVGKVRPRYLGKPHLITPETVRTRVLEFMPAAIPIVGNYLRHLSFSTPEEASQCQRICGIAQWLDTYLLQAHLPASPEEGNNAQAVLERIAAWILSRQILVAKSRQPARRRFEALDWRMRAKALRFQLTRGQAQAIEEIVADMAQPDCMHRILTGDVGSGKTAVYGCVAAAVHDMDGRVAILSPNETLARQVAREMAGDWPDLDLTLVTGSAGKGSEPASAYRVAVGTTAMLFRDAGDFDFVVVDELHKFSPDQRERLARSGAHLLEVSATPIPRSQALLKYGVVRHSRLHETHTAKDIATRLWLPQERAQLFQDVRKAIEAGEQLLVLYPRREAEYSDNLHQHKRSAGNAYEMWQQMFPGKVVLAHGALDDDSQDEAVCAMRDGRAQILVATTVVEVGVNLPKLTRAVVVDAGAFGLVTLHQIRGRLAREGGRGTFDMLMVGDAAERTRERLGALVNYSDGAQIAKADMELRGFGNLSADGTAQSGADGTVFFGRPLRPQVLEQILEAVSR